MAKLVLIVLVVSPLVGADSIGGVRVPTTDLAGLAVQGRFDMVLDQLRTRQGDDQPDERVASLVADLERYQNHESKVRSDRLAGYKEAIAAIAELAGEDQLEEALVKAIDAQGLATDPAAMLRNPVIQDLTERTQTRALQAEQAGDWVEALSLYRTLDLLFDDFSSYRGSVKRTARHIRVLRRYAPEHLHELYVARAERRGDDPPEPFNPEESSWQKELEDVKLSMLRQTLAHAARRYVNHTSYAKLLAGGIESLITLADTQGMATTFERFTDPETTQRFRDGLTGVRDGLEERGNRFNFLDAATMIERIIRLNNETVKLPRAVLVYEMAEGAMSVLDDFSAVIWPHEKKLFTRNTQGKFYGVGIQISIRDGRLVVVSPLEDTPAQRAGITAGDVIATVDGRDTSTWNLDKAVRQITGPEGTLVTLGIERGGNQEPLSFDLKRAEIVIESIRGWRRQPGGGWSYYIDPHSKIGYVRLSQFIPQSAGDLDAAVNQLREQGGLEGLILDLRFNPGGLLSSAVDVCDRFVETGSIVSTVGPDGQLTSGFHARRDHTYPSFPVVVLVNQGSASASEIVSGALQDYHRALIIGTRSFGKGSVQDLFPLDRGQAYLKLTTQYYRLPGGRIIHRQPEAEQWGIEPDIVVKMTNQQVADLIEVRQKVDVLHNGDEQPATQPSEQHTADEILEQSLDPQLEAGLLVLKTQLLAEHLAMAQRD